MLPLAWTGLISLEVVRALQDAQGETKPNQMCLFVTQSVLIENTNVVPEQLRRFVTYDSQPQGNGFR